MKPLHLSKKTSTDIETGKQGDEYEEYRYKDQETKEFHCKLCSHHTGHKGSLNRHLSNIHDINVKWYRCDQEGCTYKAKVDASVREHQSNIHDIKVDWYECSYRNCEYKAKVESSIKKHLSNIHDIGVKWYRCPEKECEYKAKANGSIKRHLVDFHDIGVKWYRCPEKECEYKAKRGTTLKSHLAYVHNINAKWYKCDQDGCKYKAKDNGSIKQHLAHIHDIGVTWHSCNQDGCEHKTKQKGALKQHITLIHDIGDNKCDFCYLHKKSSIQYKDQQGSHRICRTCFKSVTGKNSRIEVVWSNYLDERLGDEYLSGSDKSLRSLGGCLLYRPDKIYIGINLVEIDECDEKQHKGAGYTCEEKRISDIYGESGIVGKQMVVIRTNPHAYKVEMNGKLANPLKGTVPSQKERFELHAKLKLYLREHHLKLADKIHIYYLFYSPDNEVLSRNIPYSLIYSEDDFPFKDKV